ncbi:MAG: glutathione S-transferase C-terminal domain-containing protein [Alphaproteobacteria bacterium]
MVWVRELRRPEAARSDSALSLETGRVARCLDVLEKEIPPDGAGIDIAQITLGCALGVLDFRLGFHDWRAGRPRLSDWYEGFAARKSMQATIPHEA